jgi:hypothetical protein
VSQFTSSEKRQDFLLGMCFFLISAFSSVRILRSFSPTGGRKVITTFNVLIFVASFLRAGWFLLPNDLLETSYTPQPMMAFETEGWMGTLISELLAVSGSLSLYGVFILIACYWVGMLRKLTSNNNPNSAYSVGFSRFKVSELGTLEVFAIIMGIFGVIQLVNIFLFLGQVINSEQMILYDSIMLSIVSIGIVAEITILSHQIKEVLHNLEAINNRTAHPQMKRIFAIIVVANIFFVTRVILECTLSISLIQLMKGSYIVNGCTKNCLSNCLLFFILFRKT